MSELEAKRREIAELIALELGFGDLDGLSAADRAAVDRQTAETIEGCAPGEAGSDGTEPAADCSEANIRLRGLLRQFRALQVLRSDEADARLAEEGEVFGREDDA
ncbi:hypothetical protein [Methylobacterium sp. J-068]|uniref:hypothetical protein n=1 Tax=Methylobacterium sp. J-068 TaxID=2836649 RepID=UPI001FBBBCC0|nr:hypothetical protein [Methylobacterium sp. J-068]MCJ2033665.1 hypothetical protein [Methylobacterium sp. J-068]